MERSMSLEAEILTTKEAAKMLRVSQMTIRKLIKEDSLPAHKMGRKWIFLKSEVLDWIKGK
jgi:excisionase family DNA binding protein